MVETKRGYKINAGLMADDPEWLERLEGESIEAYRKRIRVKYLEVNGEEFKEDIMSKEERESFRSGAKEVLARFRKKGESEEEYKLRLAKLDGLG